MQDYNNPTNKLRGMPSTKQTSTMHTKDLIGYLLRRLVLFISFGPGIIGTLWLIGKIFKKR